MNDVMSAHTKDDWPDASLTDEFRQALGIVLATRLDSTIVERDRCAHLAKHQGSDGVDSVASENAGVSTASGVRLFFGGPFLVDSAEAVGTDRMRLPSPNMRLAGVDLQKYQLRQKRRRLELHLTGSLDCQGKMAQSVSPAAKQTTRSECDHKISSELEHADSPESSSDSDEDAEEMRAQISEAVVSDDFMRSLRTNSTVRL